ncbi:MAG: lipoyl synthase [Bacteroidales bacterium]|nr:lipoyl synthase [Bacteroidales bacterium]MBN2761924.1 lipoyl synthase [Bacteroidales bacterium]
MDNKADTRKRLPRWMKMQRASGENYSRLKNLVGKYKLHTICTSGNCPNIGECWNRGTATFMILGNICTRHCKFCSVPTGKPLPVDWEEPARVAHSVNIMKLKHCVITSVDRDDLDDLGVSLWVSVIRKIKEVNPATTMEVLIPDFQGKHALIQQVIDEKPEVISHNLETVERLTPKIRSRAKYNISLDVLNYIASSGTVAKSGIMLGLGETEKEILATMDDMLQAGVKIMTLGQYLQPTIEHMPVVEYVPPERFEKYHQIGLSKGFVFVESGPLVRSSYNADKHLII